MNLRDLQDYNKRSNPRVIGVLERDKKEGRAEIIDENISDFSRDINLPIQDAE